MPTKPKYIVTDASIYTVRPVVTEHRLRIIEETKPPRRELNRFEKFLCWVIGVPLGLSIAHWLVGLWCHCS
jgi:hypothetical protein